MNKSFYFLITSGLGLFLFFGLISCKKESISELPESNSNNNVLLIEGVAALGQLAPAGDILKLAAPVSAFGGTPRISKLLVSEGQVVNKGQTLAVFDSQPQILADLIRIKARLKTLEIKIVMKKREISRYEEVAYQGAASMVLLEEKIEELIKLQGEKEEALAEKIKLEADFSNSELKAPINGVVLRIYSRVGERSGNDGVMEVGANQAMEALIEVYESDINRVRINQEVSLVSENGGFEGTLNGIVHRISPQVRQRKVLSTDPTGDADARVVEVRVKLLADSSMQVRQLTGMKVIARFNPK